jgi:multidrug efflux pump subunit AcrA (membrane-fusion protein)
MVAEHTQAGQWLSKGDPVVTVADLLEEVEIHANVDQRQLPNVQIGAAVKVQVDGVIPSEWEGRVAALVPRSQWESGSRMFPVKVSVPNQVTEIDGRVEPVLHEGMLARVTFFGPPHEATLVPKNAIVRSETASRLYAVVPGEKPDAGKARPVILEEGGAFGERVEILSGELAAGMQVVTEGAERLTPFADIIIQTDAPPGGAPTAGGAPTPGGAPGGSAPAAPGSGASPDTHSPSAAEPPAADSAAGSEPAETTSPRPAAAADRGE